MHHPAPDPDYGGAIAAAGNTAPGALPALLAAAAGPLGGSDVAIYLADFDQVLLQPLLRADDWSGALGAGEEPGALEQQIGTTMAGRCFRTGAPVTAPRADAVQIWVPVVERSVRMGVLELSVPEASDSVIARCVALGEFAGLLITSATRYTDLFHLRRQGRTMSAAAAMQWDLLPPVTLRSPQVVSTGRLEPAYGVAGDAFDHALNGDVLHAAIFDGMGHDLPSTLMTTLAVGVYRHARRNGLDLLETYRAVDDALVAHCAGEGFVTGLLVHLNLQTGALRWITAGHPPPLVLRGRHVVGELTGEPCLPFGLREQCESVAVEHVQPGDSLLLYTDGVVESRPRDGTDLGSEQLADFWARETVAERRPDEVLRRLSQLVIAHQHGKLHDDATMLLIHWLGPRE